MKIEVLDEYKQIEKMVIDNVPLIFVSGGAGTGKSVCIDYLSKRFSGQVLKAAPTGVAALNIDGKTVHSLFRLPPKFITEDDITVLPAKQAKVYSQSKLIIIDEISMVTSNILDAVDVFMRKNTRNKAPFGGKTVVIVGDLFQLQSVVGTNLSESYYQIYDTAYFFGAKVMNKIKFEFIELKKVRRQNNADFINILSDLRVGKNIQTHIDKLNEVCSIQNDPKDGSVTLSPRNKEVDARNELELRKIRGVAEESYVGEVTGEFKSDRYPSPYFLDLKIGAQVQFTQNNQKLDVVNGSIGKVIELGQDYVQVKMTSDGRNVIVERAEWEEFSYRYDEAKRAIVSRVSGAYKQFPLKLAWSSTIHKSQGTSLDKVHIDLGAGCFTSGQLYVALSRCRTLEGITLSRKLDYDDIQVDESIISFYDMCRKNEFTPNQTELDNIFK